MGAAHLVHVFPSFEAGGAQLRIANVINHLNGRMRHTILAINGNFAARYRVRAGLAEFEAAPPKRDPLRTLADLRRTILRLSPDLILTYNWGSIDAILAMIPGGRCPIIHNECGFSGPDEMSKRRRVWARRFALNRIHKTLVTSRTMLEISRRHFGIAEGRLRFIQTGVDAARFQPARNAALRQELGVGEGEVLIGSLGGLRPEKGLDLVLEGFAASGMNGAKVALFGTGSEQSKLQELVRKLGIVSNVIFAGHREDSAACFQAMDVFVMSSLTEQTPNALLEAMASGLPAVCTDAGDTAYLLGDEQAPYVVAARDPAAYGACLFQLGDDEALRKRLGNLNRTRCLDHFPMERMLDEYVEAYEEVLGR